MKMHFSATFKTLRNVKMYCIPALRFLNDSWSSSLSYSHILSTNDTFSCKALHSARPNCPKLYGTFFKTIPTKSIPRSGGNLISTLQNLYSNQHNPVINLPPIKAHRINIKRENTVPPTSETKNHVFKCDF